MTIAHFSQLLEGKTTNNDNRVAHKTIEKVKVRATRRRRSNSRTLHSFLSETRVAGNNRRSECHRLHHPTGPSAYYLREDDATPASSTPPAAYGIPPTTARTCPCGRRAVGRWARTQWRHRLVRGEKTCPSAQQKSLLRPLLRNPYWSVPL
jgi:hypothetical protein